MQIIFNKTHFIINRGPFPTESTYFVAESKKVSQNSKFSKYNIDEKFSCIPNIKSIDSTGIISS